VDHEHAERAAMDVDGGSKVRPSWIQLKLFVMDERKVAEEPFAGEASWDEHLIPLHAP
jgi:hypothetical protein